MRRPHKLVSELVGGTKRVETSQWSEETHCRRVEERTSKSERKVPKAVGCGIALSKSRRKRWNRVATGR